MTGKGIRYVSICRKQTTTCSAATTTGRGHTDRKEKKPAPKKEPCLQTLFELLLNRYAGRNGLIHPGETNAFIPWLGYPDARTPAGVGGRGPGSRQSDAKQIRGVGQHVADASRHEETMIA